MCIRDRGSRLLRRWINQPLLDVAAINRRLDAVQGFVDDTLCLLYTSDAADERSSVDLGGRRIIKKKKRAETEARRHTTKTKEDDDRTTAST